MAGVSPHRGGRLPPPRLRILWNACALAACLVTVSGTRAQITDAQRIRIAERLRDATVTVEAGPSSGSGFLVPPEGWVVTNAHVASGARRTGRMRVRLSDGSRRWARLLAYDPTVDLAVAKVQGKVTTPGLPLGDSDGVKVGQTVLAFGSPFGLEGTLTQGIVSARRDVAAIGAGGVRNVIQTDAPINPGNSGGPLVDATGHVVGVNTAILSRSGTASGIGFAVPSNRVKALLDDLRKHVARSPSQAATRRGRQAARRDGASAVGHEAVWLGVYGEDFRGRGYRGVRVRQVVPDSPADAAGLLGATDRPPRIIRQLGIPWTGHIILAVDAHPVRSMGELKALLARHGPGEQAVVTVTIGPGILTGETVVELARRPRRHPRTKPGGRTPRHRGNRRRSR